MLSRKFIDAFPYRGFHNNICRILRVDITVILTWGAIANGQKNLTAYFIYALYMFVNFSNLAKYNRKKKSKLGLEFFLCSTIHT